jgi:uncharacterized protein YjbJ (UPF0337 family)
MEHRMNKTVIDGKLKQIRGQAKAWSGQLAGDPLAQAAGKFDQLIGSLQARFGYSRERAERELKRRLAKHHTHATVR